MYELSLREIQEVEKNILEALDVICRKINVKYYIHYGTLIGAVRHHGFIPWDDDIDVVMLREDYNKLIKYYRDDSSLFGKYILRHYLTSSDASIPIARMIDPSYLVYYNNLKENGTGLFVDIYPLDYCKDLIDKDDLTLQFRFIDKLLVSAIVVGGQEKYVKSPNGLFSSIKKWFAFYVVKVLGLNTLISHLDLRAQRHSKSEFVGCIIWYTTGSKAINIEDLESTEFQFEDIVVRGPKGYDKLLKNCYGNYMILPSEEQRVNHHSYRAYKKN